MGKNKRKNNLRAAEYQLQKRLESVKLTVSCRFFHLVEVQLTIDLTGRDHA